LVKGTYDENDYNPDAVIEEVDSNEEFENMSDNEKKMPEQIP
jgi:DNA/RNA-binding domain of Phe-tRNA-synthetase-like protein